MNFIEYKYKDIGKIRSGKRLKKGYKGTPLRKRWSRIPDSNGFHTKRASAIIGGKTKGRDTECSETHWDWCMSACGGT